MNLSLRNTDFLSNGSIISNASSPSNFNIGSDNEKKPSFIHSVEEFDRQISKEPSFLENCQLQIKNKENWAYSQECLVCTRKFNNLKGFFQHHCRVCGGSVCTQCSTHNISDQKSCDICYVRMKSKNLIERKMNLLNIKEKNITELEKKIRGVKKDIDSIGKEVSDYDKIKPKEIQENSERLQEFNEELKKLKQICIKKQENRKRMVENVQVDQKLLFEKQNDVSQIENKIKLLHQSAQKNKNTILSKTEDMNFLKHQLNKLQESESFAVVIQNANNSNVFSSTIVAFMEKRGFSLAMEGDESQIRVNSIEISENTTDNAKKTGGERRKITMYEKRNILKGVLDSSDNARTSRTPSNNHFKVNSSSYAKEKYCFSCKTEQGKCNIY